MGNFWFHVQYGINHVIDINGYDHVLFLTALAVPFIFNNWKRVLVLVSLFTLGHTLSLVLASYNMLQVNAKTVELLIPITISIAAVYNIFTASKPVETKKAGVLFLTTLGFGLIHGFGFAREFNMLLDDSESKLQLLIAFALGIEIAQVIIVFVVLFLGYLAQVVFKVSKRDWKLTVSAIIIGLVIPMILERL